MNQPKHVLDGYKVLDFTQIVAGPTCTLMLAEMGAEVIKVELAPAGDGARIGPVIVDGRSGYFVQHNRGKKDLCLNAKTPEGAGHPQGVGRESRCAGRELCSRSYRPSGPRLRRGESDQSPAGDVLDFRLWADRTTRPRTRFRLGGRGLLRRHFDGGREGRSTHIPDGGLGRRLHRSACYGRGLRRVVIP